MDRPHPHPPAASRQRVRHSHRVATEPLSTLLLRTRLASGREQPRAYGLPPLVRQGHDRRGAENHLVLRGRMARRWSQSGMRAVGALTGLGVIAARRVAGAEGPPVAAGGPLAVAAVVGVLEG